MALREVRRSLEHLVLRRLVQSLKSGESLNHLVALAREQMEGPQVGPHNAEIAGHFLKAQVRDRALAHLLRAGEYALSVGDYAQAVRCFQQGLAMKEGQPVDGDAAAMKFGLAQALCEFLTGHPRLGGVRPAPHLVQEVLIHLSSAFEFYWSTGDVSGVTAVAEFPMRPVPGMPTGMLEFIQRALEIAPSGSLEQGRLLFRRGVVLSLEQGRREEGQAAFRQALLIAQQGKDRALAKRILANWAGAEFYGLRWQNALERTHQALEVVGDTGEAGPELVAAHHGWMAAATVGDVETLDAYSQKMLELTARLPRKDQFWEASALWANETRCYLRGQWTESRRYSLRSQEFWENDWRTLLVRSLVEHQSGNAEEGQNALGRAIDLMHSGLAGGLPEAACVGLTIPAVTHITGNPEVLDTAALAIKAVLNTPSTPFFEMYARVGLALMAAQGHGLEIASLSDQYAALCVLCPDTDAMTMAASVDRVLGLLSVALGEMDRAAAHFKKAREFCRRAGYWPEYAWSCLDHAEALLQERNGASDLSPKAAQLLDEAVTLATRLGMRPLLERALRVREEHEAYPDGLREVDLAVLRRFASGLEVPEISRELGYVESTIYSRLSRIVEKTGVNRNPYLLARYARQHRLM